MRLEDGFVRRLSRTCATRALIGEIFAKRDRLRERLALAQNAIPGGAAAARPAAQTL